MREVRYLISGCVALASAATVVADVQFNEAAIDLPGTDNGVEFIELRSDTPSFSMSGLTLLVIEGDGASPGLIDQALNLGAFSTGTNNLFLCATRQPSLCRRPPPRPR